MKIIVGSENKVKIAAVRETIKGYSFLKYARVKGQKVPSDVSFQPTTLTQTMNGARNRAMNAFYNCDFSFGIEDGIMRNPLSVEKFDYFDYMNVCACVIFDGKRLHTGLAPCFSYPADITWRVIIQGIDVNDAMYNAGFTKKKKIGSYEGAIGMFTKGRQTRKENIMQAIMMALVSLEGKK